MAEVTTTPTYGAYDPKHYDTATTVPSLLKRISWGAILAGTAVALGILILMGLLGTAIGIGAIDPGEEANPLSGIGTGTIIWWIISSLVALFVGGRVAGQLAGFPSRATAMLHGLTVWALVTFLTTWLAASAFSMVANTAANAVATAAQGVASAAGAVAPDDVDLSGIEIPDATAEELARQAKQEAADLAQEAGLSETEAEEAGQILEGTAQDIVRSPGDLGADIDNMIDQLFRGEGAVVSPSERDRLVNELSAELGVTPAEAERTVDAWVNEAESAAGSVTDTVETGIGDAADTLSAIAWGAFFMSLAALLAGIFGAASGAPKEPYLRTHHHDAEHRAA